MATKKSETKGGDGAAVPPRDTGAPNPGEGQGAAPGLPLFYTKPVPLSRERHGGKGLKPLDHYRFSASSNSIPLTADEFWTAARHYPVLFVRSDPPMPIALVGVRSGQNLFVDGDGQWDPSAYVPAYVRRYPFVFMSVPDQERLVLCVDEGSGFVDEKGSDPARLLYEADKPSQIVNNALNFCAEFQRRHTRTQEFAAALAENDLLIERAAKVELTNGETLNLTGFAIINEEKLDELPNKTFLDWRRKGWLPLIYLHLASLQSWSALIDRASRSAAAA